LLALVFSRVRSRDVETSILHKIEIGVSTADLSPAGKAFAAVCDQNGIISSGSGIGLGLFCTILIVLCHVRPGIAVADPGGGANEQ